MKYRKQVEWAVAVIQRQYVQWKKRQFLLTLHLRMAGNVMSPTCVDWPTVPSFLAETSLLLRNIHHRWKVKGTFVIYEKQNLILFKFLNFSATCTASPLTRRHETE